MRSSDRGSASIWVLGIGCAIVTFAATVAVAGGLLIARHSARAAADLAALAGAARWWEGEVSACERAGAVAAAQHATIITCDLEGMDLSVTVEVAAPTNLGKARVSARAGPRLRVDA